MPFKLKEYWLGTGEHHWQDPSGAWNSEAWVPSLTLTLKNHPQSGVSIFYNGQFKGEDYGTLSGLTLTIPAPSDFVSLPDSIDRIDVEYDW